jgi:hypothetical protein
MASMSVLEYWKSFELELKMTNAMSQPHRTLNSMAFFMRPFFLFVKVTCVVNRGCCIVPKVSGQGRQKGTGAAMS